MIFKMFFRGGKKRNTFKKNETLLIFFVSNNRVEITLEIQLRIGGGGGMDWGGQKVQTSSYMNESWGCGVQHGDYT